MFQEYLNLMVYLDFLHARGGEAGKGLARGLTYHVRSLRLNLIHLAGDEKVEWREPEDYDRVMAAEATRARQLYTDLTIELIWAQWPTEEVEVRWHLEPEFANHSAPQLWYSKWVINHRIPTTGENRTFFMVHRENTYYHYGDHGGSLVFFHVVSPGEDPENLKPSFLKRFGELRGTELYNEYAVAKRRVNARLSTKSDSGTNP